MTDDKLVERVARAMEPDAWDALAGRDLIKHSVRRAQSLRNAEAAIRAIEATRSSEVIEALTEAKREIEIGLEYVIEAANEDGCKYGKEAKVFKQHMRGIERMEMLLAKIDKALSTPSSENSDGASMISARSGG